MDYRSSELPSPELPRAIKGSWIKHHPLSRKTLFFCHVSNVCASQQNGVFLLSRIDLCIIGANDGRLERWPDNYIAMAAQQHRSCLAELRRHRSTKMLLADQASNQRLPNGRASGSI